LAQAVAGGMIAANRTPIPFPLVSGVAHSTEEDVMRFVIPCLALAALIALAADGRGDSKDTTEKDTKKTAAGSIKLPVPDVELTCDITAWKDSFILQKMTYNKEDNKIVFLLKTRRMFKFTDDGFVAPMQFLDEEGVNLNKDNKMEFEHDITKLKPGELTRLTLTLPDEETLKKTKKCKIVLQGFFTDKKK
jgi:hypothetical protein